MNNYMHLEKIKDKSGNNIPRDIPYAIKVESSCPIVGQHTRLDTTQPELSLMTTNNGLSIKINYYQGEFIYE